MNGIDRYAFPALAALSAVATVVFHTQANDGGRLFAAIGAVLFACAAVIQRDARWGAVATAGWATFANGYLLYEKVAASGEKALCSVNEVIDCSRVNASEYSELMGVPITLFGVAFYLGLIAAGVAGGKGDRFHQANGLFALVSLAYSLFLANVSRQMGLVCPFCLSIYAANLMLLWSAMRGLKSEGGNLFADLGGALSARSALIITAGFVLVTGGGLAAIGGSQPAPVGGTPGKAGFDPTAALVPLVAQPEGEVTMDGTEPVYGNPSAPYLILEWADYACPHCAHAAKELKQLVKDNPDVQVRFRVFPLTGQCNPGLQDGGPERCMAALAAECAGQQGKFWEVNSAIFLNQRYIDPDSLRMMASDAGVDVPTWEACLANPATLEGVVADALAGQKAGISGTPTLFVKGTHGDRFVLATHGPDAAMRLIEAHRDGVTMPEPRKLEAMAH